MLTLKRKVDHPGLKSANLNRNCPAPSISGAKITPKGKAGITKIIFKKYLSQV